MTLMIYKNERNSHLQIYIYIYKLIELCLSTNYFILDNRVCILENSGPIDLALIVMISKVFPQRLEGKAVQEALTTDLALLTYERYVVGSLKVLNNTTVS